MSLRRTAEVKWYSRLTLGGRLTLLNLVLFAGVVWWAIAADQSDGLSPLRIVAAAILMFPIALPVSLFLSAEPTVAEVVVMCIVFGLNSFVWGYGLATFVRWIGVAWYWQYWHRIETADLTPSKLDSESGSK
jgi:hypothetical protein